VVFSIINKVRKKEMAEKDSLLWLFAAVLVFILSLFPVTIVKLAGWIGVSYPPTLLFLLALIWLVSILLRKEVQINKLNHKITELAQKTAILEEQNRTKSHG